MGLVDRPRRHPALAGVVLGDDRLQDDEAEPRGRVGFHLLGGHRQLPRRFSKRHAYLTTRVASRDVDAPAVERPFTKIVGERIVGARFELFRDLRASALGERRLRRELASHEMASKARIALTTRARSVRSRWGPTG